MDHFGPGIDYLDIHAEDEVVNFTCFTERAANGDGASYQHTFRTITNANKC